MAKKPTITETIRLNRLRTENGRKQNSPKSIIYELEATRLRSRPGNRRQNAVWEVGRLVGGKGWKQRVYNREEWKKLLRMAGNCHILHMPME